jgi:hypothetical protein
MNSRSRSLRRNYRKIRRGCSENMDCSTRRTKRGKKGVRGKCPQELKMTNNPLSNLRNRHKESPKTQTSPKWPVPKNELKKSQKNQNNQNKKCSKRSEKQKNPKYPKNPRNGEEKTKRNSQGKESPETSQPQVRE